MSAIAFADEMSETKKKIANLESEIAALKTAREEDSGANSSMTDALANVLEQAAVRIEKVAKEMR